MVGCHSPHVKSSSPRPGTLYKSLPLCGYVKMLFILKMCVCFFVFLVFFNSNASILTVLYTHKDPYPNLESLVKKKTPFPDYGKQRVILKWLRGRRAEAFGMLCVTWESLKQNGGTMQSLLHIPICLQGYSYAILNALFIKLIIFSLLFYNLSENIFALINIKILKYI